MIASISGILKIKNPTELLIEVNGIGYNVSIPISTFEKIGELNSNITLLTYLHVREDVLQLYGFYTEEERRLFKLLISISGIGPKIAQSILSGMNVAELKTNIVNGNISALTTVPGIGRKTAERLVLELRDKVAKSLEETEEQNGATTPEIRNEALQALISLGYNQQLAEKSIRLVIKEAQSVKLTLEELIKRALKQINIK